MKLFWVIGVVDSIIGLVNGENMYTLKPGGMTGIAVNLVTLCILLALAAWRVQRRRAAYRRFTAAYALAIDEFETEERLSWLEVLGLGPDASAQDVRRSYRLLAKRLHPDRSPNDPDAHERFLEVQAAYEALGRP